MMQSDIVADGAERLRRDPKHQARLRELRESIRARNAEELARAGYLRRWLLRWRIAMEYRKERRKIVPSVHALYSSR